MRIRDEVDPEVARTFIRNFFVNAATLGMYRQRRISERYGCICPWAILVDPTTACNLHCQGCWAAHYEDERHKSPTYEELDSIVRQGTELGTYLYLFTGGEPLVRAMGLRGGPRRVFLYGSSRPRRRSRTRAWRMGMSQQPGLRVKQVSSDQS